ncbi:NAD(P)/FAD-dependent oxidoreductase [Kineococcus arenarius]|uniref:NAD(P)/FAD-dependent oxidoreductase n=1 Tax=Kineococcus sp. SYSU DK007 TaxID=3383128 RepID=UPI003D7F01C9
MIPSATSPDRSDPLLPAIASGKASPSPAVPSPQLPPTADVVVVGAGLAGLACAKHLSAAGVEVAVVEASDGVGGRVRSDLVDGFRVDRGFQLVNPAYPELHNVLDVAALDLQPFDAGVAVHRGGRVSAVRDPRRHPAGAVEALRFPFGGVKDKAAVARWVLKLTGPGDLKDPDSGWWQALDEAGVHGELRWSVVEPFLAGVLGEVDGTTSRRFVDLVVRSFLRGTPGLPAGGVQALPDQLAAALPAGSVVLGTEVRHLGLAPRSLVAETTAGGVNAQAIVVATEAGAAGHLVPGLPVPEAHALTAFWYVTPSSPAPASREKLLHLDGERGGPVVNTAVVSAVAPSYVPAGDRRGLVSALVLGREASAASEARVRAQLGRVYGADTAAWELIAVHDLPHALPALPPPFDGPRPVEVGDGIFVTGDHRENPSQQGALVAGRRAADAVLTRLGMGRRRAG